MNKRIDGRKPTIVLLYMKLLEHGYRIALKRFKLAAPYNKRETLFIDSRSVKMKWLHFLHSIKRERYGR